MSVGAAAEMFGGEAAAGSGAASTALVRRSPSTVSSRGTRAVASRSSAAVNPRSSTSVASRGSSGISPRAVSSPSLAFRTRGITPQVITTAAARPRRSPSPARASRPSGFQKSAPERGGSDVTINLTQGDGGGTDWHKIVIAEYIACVFLVGIAPITTRSPSKDRHVYVANDFVRLTAVSLVFFILALLSNTPKFSKLSAAFGGLVTLGVVYNATPTLTAIGNIFTNASAKGGGIETAAAGTQKIQNATFSPNNLQDTTGLSGAVPAVSPLPSSSGGGIAA